MNVKKNLLAELLREKTGLKISEYAKEKNVSRKEIYEAIKGRGSRKIRIDIAIKLNYQPSILWGNKENIARKVDDIVFEETRQN